uniref:pyruvate dehydrogenase E1 component beta subunit n=1 Tax=Gloiopeltis furcata TaxID=42017 RepID=UPI0028D854C2|nr:pyruvate dehydrogenase E1 component beta subunit [Gloiopeltis furcata]WMP13903.1 pyruvate dehydrogenase E1 component beta subunit [Gloiopeltis furcata]
MSSDILDPVADDLTALNINLKKMVGAKHPVLYAAAEHLFNAGGKRIRPAIVLLVAQATLKEVNILPEHRRLAEITEIIHTASLMHDDVVDECQTRRGVDTVHSTFGTKTAVLAGDFLFAQSSWYLANLNNLEVVKTISKVITDFAEGEIRQGISSFDGSMSIDDYIEKSFYKTASLIAASCKGASMLSSPDTKMQSDFYLYGKHIGLAFQIIDDILDVVGSSKSLGKPAGIDLNNGNLTSPLFFALEESSELQNIINREFQNRKDIYHVIHIIKETNGLEKAKDLAEEHIQAALNVLNNKYESIAINTLRLIGNYILYRIN